MSGPISTSTTRNDFKLLQIWFTVAKYFAFTPCNIQSVNPNTTPTSKCFASKIYPLFLLLLYLAANGFSFYERISNIYKIFNFSQIVLDTLQGVMEWIFIEVVVIWSVLKRNKWRKLLRSITQVDQKMNLNIEKDCNLRKITVTIFLYHLVYIAAHAYDSFANWTDVSYSLAFVIFRFTTYYILFSTLFVKFLCTWLKNRYVFLDHCLKESVIGGGTKFKLIFLDRNEPRFVSYDKLKEFSQNYRNLFLIVQEMNYLFGYQMFFISICTVLEILNAVNYGIPMKNVVAINNNTFVNTLYSTLYVICNTNIVMACDSVEKCGRKIRTTCLILLESSEKYEVKEELSRMANYIHGLCPQFTAAGFWHVNQQVLSTLFASVMTYLIIIIQFNIALK